MPTPKPKSSPRVRMLFKAYLSSKVAKPYHLEEMKQFGRFTETQVQVIEGLRKSVASGKQCVNEAVSGLLADNDFAFNKSNLRGIMRHRFNCCGFFKRVLKKTPTSRIGEIVAIELATPRALLDTYIKVGKINAFKQALPTLASLNQYTSQRLSREQVLTQLEALADRHSVPGIEDHLRGLRASLDLENQSTDTRVLRPRA